MSILTRLNICDRCAFFEFLRIRCSYTGGWIMKKVMALLMTVQCSVLLAATDNETPQDTRANQPIKFSVTAGAGYTDNRDGLPKKESNVDFYITPMLALDLKWEETMLELSYAPSFRYRNSPSEFQNKSQLYHDFAANFKHKLSPSLEFRLIDNFNVTDDPSVQENGSTLRRDYSFTLNQTEVGAKYDISRLSNIDVLARYMFKRYDDTAARTESDENRTDAGITFWHQPIKHLALTAAANYSQYGYEKYLNTDRGFDSTLLGVGLEEVVSSDFRVGVKGGMQNVKYADKSMGSDSSPYGTVFAKVSTVPSTHITASVSKMVRESFIFPFASQDMTDFSVRLDWIAPAPEFMFALTGSYRVGDYAADTIPDALKSQYATDPLLKDYVSSYNLKESGKENTYAISGEVAYQISLGTTIKFVQSYENVDSDVRWSFNRNSSNIMLTREF